MIRIRVWGQWLCASLLATIVGCGGGGSEWAGIDGSGAPVQISASGPINGFGSVIVNGVRYTTEDAEVFVRGVATDEYALNVGDYITVIAEKDNDQWRAQEVHYSPLVSGPIDEIDGDLQQISLLGQTVQITPDTTFANAFASRDISALSVGQKISISGISDGEQVIVASRISLAEERYAAELSGPVSQLDTAAFEFTLNGQRIDYSAVAYAQSLVEGDRVSVVGERNETGVFVADTLRVTDSFGDETLQFTEVSGPAFYWNPQNRDFFVAGRHIQIIDDTTFSGGTQEDLGNPGMMVRVRGQAFGPHTINAHEISFVPVSTMRVVGTVEQISPWQSGHGFGEIYVQGQPYLVNTRTRLIGEQDSRLTFYDLRVGDTVLIGAYNMGEENLASSVTVDSRFPVAEPMVMHGMPYMVSEPMGSFFLYSTRIQTTDDTVFHNGFAAIDEQEFYQYLMHNQVMATGVKRNGVLYADEVRYIYWGFFSGWPTPPPPQ